MTKEEAKAFIEAFIKLRNLATDEMSLEVPNLYPAWRPDMVYESGERLLYSDVLYKVLQGHTSQASWTPDVTASLYTKVLVADDGTVLAWVQPDSTNAYMKGDKVLHNGKVWESLVDNNVWEPGAVGTEALWRETA